MSRYEKSFWCPWPESNQHSLRNSILSRARLPVPPQGPSEAWPRPASRSRRNIAGGCRGSTRAEVIVPCLDRVIRRGYDALIGTRPPVTSATANPSRAGMSANPALTAALAVAIIAAATLAGAWFFQLVLDIRPCPLCLEQRYAYYLALPLGALVAFAAMRGAPRPVLLAGLAILVLPPLRQSLPGGYHARGAMGRWAGAADCTRPGGHLRTPR